jgi:hypothetical protein
MGDICRIWGDDYGWLSNDCEVEVATDAEVRTLTTALSMEIARKATFEFSPEALAVVRRFLDRLVAHNAVTQRARIFEATIVAFLTRRCQRIGESLQQECARAGEDTVSEARIIAAIRADVAKVRQHPLHRESRAA